MMEWMLKHMDVIIIVGTILGVAAGNMFILGRMYEGLLNKFEKHDARFKSLDERLEEFEERVTRHDRTLHGVDGNNGVVGRLNMIQGERGKRGLRS